MRQITFLKKLGCGGLLLIMSLSGCSVANENGLSASILHDQKIDAYYVKLENSSTSFLCINSMSLDTSNGSIVLTDKNGVRIAQLATGEAGGVRDLGFDYSPSYLILRPGEERDVYIDMANFTMTEGKYNYSIIVGAYLCKDVVDESRLLARRNVKGMSIQQEGVIVVSKEFANEISSKKK